MFKKIHDWLLTHHPLIWNTKIVWVLAISILVHLFFFLSGYGAITPFVLQNHYDLNDIITGTVLTFSVLCSLAMIIIWLVFYLRNNAYKSFFIIHKYHSAKEFLIIFFIILSNIIYFESYKLGACLRTRSITSRQQLVKEANTANLARAFVPRDKGDYFKLIDCDNTSGHPVAYSPAINYFDSTRSDFYDSNSVLIRKALQEKDAFSYKNYCNELIGLDEYDGFLPSGQWRVKKNRWIDNHNADSIRQVLEECVAICRKYNIEQRIDPEEMTRLVFVDSFNNVTHFFVRDFTGTMDNEVDFFDDNSLRRVLSRIDQCYLDNTGGNDWMELLTVEIYIAVCMAILLFSYRLYSKKVFLISVVGTIVWCIIFALFAVSSGGNGIPIFYLLLFGVFILMAVVSLKSQGNKTASGVLLNWHIYMLPFVIMIIANLIIDEYEKHTFTYYHGNYTSLPDEVLKARYPVGYWVDKHIVLIVRLNLLLVLLYTVSLFTRLSKKWHIQAEE